MAALYLAKTYGKSIRWAIAGRRLAALERVKDDIMRVNHDLNDVDIIIADSDNIESLNEMTILTKVVITTAGQLWIQYDDDSIFDYYDDCNDDDTILYYWRWKGIMMMMMMKVITIVMMINDISDDD